MAKTLKPIQVQPFNRKFCLINLDQPILIAQIHSFFNYCRDRFWTRFPGGPQELCSAARPADRQSCDADSAARCWFCIGGCFLGGWMRMRWERMLNEKKKTCGFHGIQPSGLTSNLWVIFDKGVVNLYIDIPFFALYTSDSEPITGLKFHRGRFKGNKGVFNVFVFKENQGSNTK